MQLFIGLDMSGFPGLETTAWLKQYTAAAWLGFYLGPAPSHPDKGWMAARADLVEQGWGLAPIFVGQESAAGPGSHFIDALHGQTDGMRTAALMSSAGFPEHSNVFLDLEDGPPFVEPRISYVKAWAGEVASEGYTPAIYCSHAIADGVASLFASEDVAAPFLWVFKVSTTVRHPADLLPTPEPSEAYPAAVMLQHEQNVTLPTPAGALLVDVSSSIVSDPSHR